MIITKWYDGTQGPTKLWQQFIIKITDNINLGLLQSK